MLRATRVVPIAIVLVVWTLTTHGKYSDSGDEPHYLMVAESLTSDHDLDVANNYRNGDGRWFGADSLEAGPHARVTRHGSTWSTHDLGLPILLWPIYAAATRVSLLVPDDVLRTIRQPRGLFAYSLISLTLVVLTASAIGLLMSGLGRQTTWPWRVTAIALALGLSPPVMSHAFLVFPETPAFAVMCAAVWLWCLRPEELTLPRVWTVVFAIGCLPWLHRRYAFFAVGVIVVLVAQHAIWLKRQSRRVLWLLAAAAIVPQLCLHASTLYAWGSVGGPQLLDTLPFSVAGAARGGLGLLFDRERGLVAHAPIYLILPACWAAAWPACRPWLVPVALLFLPMASFSVWGAGFSPAARYLVPLMPLLVVPATRALDLGVIRWASAPLVLLQVAVTATVWQSPRLLWPRELGTNEALERIPWIGPAYEQLLPSLLTGDALFRGWVLLGMAVVTVVATTYATGLPGTDLDRPRQ